MRTLSLVLLGLGGGGLSWILLFGGAFGSEAFLIAGVLAAAATLLSLRGRPIAQWVLGAFGLLWAAAAAFAALQSGWFAALLALPGWFAFLGAVAGWFARRDTTSDLRYPD